MIQADPIPEDRRRDHPHSGVPARAFWAGIYDHVFVALHPFTTAPCEPDDPAGDFALAARADTRNWAEVAAGLGAPRFDDFALALEMATFGVTSKQRIPTLPVPDDDLIRELHRLTAAERLCFPWNDSPAPSFWPRIAKALRAVGAAGATAYSEFGLAAAAVTADEFERSERIGALPHAANHVRAANGALLVSASSRDDIWSFIALTDAGRARFDPAAHFEGFWAGPSTTATWINEPGTCDPPPGWPK